MDTNTHQWTLNDGVKLATELRDVLAPLGFCLGITGGAIFKGYSDKDLDLVIYPLKEKRDYVNALDAIGCHIGASIVYVDHNQSGKIVFTLTIKSTGKKVDVFIPGFLPSERTDRWPTAGEIDGSGAFDSTDVGGELLETNNKKENQ